MKEEAMGNENLFPGMISSVLASVLGYYAGMSGVDRAKLAVEHAYRKIESGKLQIDNWRMLQRGYKKILEREVPLSTYEREEAQLQIDVLEHCCVEMTEENEKTLAGVEKYKEDAERREVARKSEEDRLREQIKELKGQFASVRRALGVDDD